MYICTECGNVFEEMDVKRWKESHGESFICCPKCFGSLEEAEKCNVCGGYSCDCEDKIMNKFKKLIFENFTDEEINIIDKKIEGVYLSEI